MDIIRNTILTALLLIPALLFAETVNINTADKETLMTVVKGVGEKRAEAIITYREQNGPFKSIDELAEVNGISTSIVENNRENISVDNK